MGLRKSQFFGVKGNLNLFWKVVSGRIEFRVLGDDRVLDSAIIDVESESLATTERSDMWIVLVDAPPKSITTRPQSRFLWSCVASRTCRTCATVVLAAKSLSMGLVARCWYSISSCDSGNLIVTPTHCPSTGTDDRNRSEIR